MWQSTFHWPNKGWMEKVMRSISSITRQPHIRAGTPLPNLGWGKVDPFGMEGSFPPDPSGQEGTSFPFTLMHLGISYHPWLELSLKKNVQISMNEHVRVFWPIYQTSNVVLISQPTTKIWRFKGFHLFVVGTNCEFFAASKGFNSLVSFQSCRKQSFSKPK